MKLYITNAFSNRSFSGNTAGIIILDKSEDFPNKDIMIHTARELRYSETAFVKQINTNNFHIRYFTSVDEVNLCGHATIGAFGALMDCEIVKDNHTYQIDTIAGKLEVNIENQLIFIEMGSHQELGQITSSIKLEELADIMGTTANEIGILPQVISTGLPDIMLHVKTKEILMKLRPDFQALSKLSQEYSVVGVHAFALSNEYGITAYCRNFAPLYNINEEAATGTSNGALTYYLYKNGVIDGSRMNTFLQGESMGRPSQIFTYLEEIQQAIKIKVGGQFKVVAKGEIFL